MLADAWPRWLLLAAARPRCIPSRSPRSRVVARRKMVPRTFGRHAPNACWYRGVVEATFAQRGPRRPPARTDPSSRLGYTASSRRLVTPSWHRRAGGHRGIGEPAFGPGVSWAATTSDQPQVDVVDHSQVMTLQRFRDTAADTVCADKMCGAPIFRTATTLDRGCGPARHPGRAPARYHRGRATASSEPLWPSAGEQPSKRNPLQ
jgi:hypothetical protein